MRLRRLRGLAYGVKKLGAGSPDKPHWAANLHEISRYLSDRRVPSSDGAGCRPLHNGGLAIRAMALEFKYR